MDLHIKKIVLFKTKSVLLACTTGFAETFGQNLTPSAPLSLTCVHDRA